MPPPRQRTSLTHVCPPPFPWLMLLPVTCRRDGLRSQRPPVISFARTAGVMLHPGICGRNCSPCDRLWSTSSRPFTNRAHIDSFDEWLTVLSIGVYYRLILLKSLFRSIVYDTSSIGLLLVACDVMCVTPPMNLTMCIRIIHSLRVCKIVGSLENTLSLVGHKTLTSSDRRSEPRRADSQPQVGVRVSLLRRRDRSISATACRS